MWSNSQDRTFTGKEIRRSHSQRQLKQGSEERGKRNNECICQVRNARCQILDRVCRLDRRSHEEVDNERENRNPEDSSYMHGRNHERSKSMLELYGNFTFIRRRADRILDHFAQDKREVSLYVILRREYSDVVCRLSAVPK